MKKPEKNNTILIVYTLLTVLLLVFTFKDIEIGMAFANKDALWVKFFVNFAQLPAFFFTFLAFSLLFRLRSRKNLVLNILSAVFTLYFMLYGAVATWSTTSGYLLYDDPNKGSEAQGWVFAIIIITVSQIWLYRKSDEQLHKYKRIALIAAIMLPFVYISYNLFKFYWGRVRFRDMLPDYSNFTPWYLPQGHTGNRSFVSGHTSNGWSMILITLFCAKESVIRNQVLWTTAILWGTLTAVSRVVIMAHFPSDVLCATLLALTTFFVLRHYIKA